MNTHIRLLPSACTKHSIVFSVITAAIAATVCCGCTHVYYAPNSANAPLLSAKGETRLNALYSTGALSDFTGEELQCARAVSNNIGMMVNYFSADNTETMSDGLYNASSHTEKGRGTYLEIAGGYFKGLDAKKKWIAELYAGCGFGTTANDYGYENHSRVSVGKYFFQPAIGFKTRNVEAAFVPKLSWVTWRVKEAAISNDFVWPVFDELKAINEQPAFMAFEPAFLFRFGTSGVKIQCGISYSNFRKRSLYWTGSLQENCTGSMGISVNLLPGKKKS